MNSNVITDGTIDDLIERSTITTAKMGAKTLVLCAALPSGFEVVVSSACVDPANYDEALGRKLAMEKLRDRLWELEGYRLQLLLANT